MNSNKVAKSKLSFVLSLSVLIYGLFFSVGCKPEAEVDLNYSPNSMEEQFFISKFWCGTDYVAYSGLPPGSKANTLFKVKPSLGGTFKVETVTLSPTFYDRQSFDIPCVFIDMNTLQCSGRTVSYQINNNARGVLTNLLTSQIPELSLTQLMVCTGNELDQF